ASSCSRPDLAPLFEEQLTTLVDTMKPWAQDEMMPNLLSARQGTTPEDLRAVYGPRRYDRLAAIKKQYDPDNLFRVNHNIVPSDSTRPPHPKGTSMNTPPVDDATNVLADPTAYADDERLHTALRQLRATNPVAWVDHPPYRPFWAITKHADIMGIER